MGVVRGPLAQIHKMFEEMYGFKPQEEGEGDHLPSLEANIRVDAETGEMGIRLKRRTEGVVDVVRSLVPSLAKNCLFYATTLRDIYANVKVVVLELLGKSGGVVECHTQIHLGKNSFSPDYVLHKH